MSGRKAQDQMRPNYNARGQGPRGSCLAVLGLNRLCGPATAFRSFPEHQIWAAASVLRLALLETLPLVLTSTQTDTK